MLQYAGVDLLMPDPGGWLESFLQRTALDSLDLFGASPVAACDQRTQAVGSHQPITPYPIPNYRTAPPLKINQLYWPSGAARWSTFVGLIDSDGLDEIRKEFESESFEGTNAQIIEPQPFIIGDANFEGTIEGTRSLVDGEDRKAVYTQLYMLEPRAVSVPQGRETLWFLPLVDIRYFWQFTRLPHRTPQSLIDQGETEASLKQSWNGWLKLLQCALDPRTASTRDVSLEFLPSTIATDYFYPDHSELDQTQHNAALALDAIAHSCGRRFVRQFDGRCELIDPVESKKRHAAHVTSPTFTGGGVAMLTPSDASKIDATTTASPPLEKMAIYPQYVDVVFRKLVEFDEDDVPADVPNQFGDFPPTQYQYAEILAGTGTRTIRNRSELKGAHNVVKRTSQVIYTPSWVGLHLWHDGTSGNCPEPAGLIDNVFYGDRYFRLAEQITEDVIAWKAQQHEYDMPDFHPWYLSGFDDSVTWDHQRGSTHIRSHSNDFGVSTQLVQVHRQCSFDPNMVVGVISSDWTLYPKELEQPPDPNIEQDDDCLLLTEDNSIGSACELDITTAGVTSDLFDFTWQWAEAEVRPFIPTDPWAVVGSIQYGRTMVWAGSSIVGVTRSQKIIQLLRDQLDCVTVVGANAPDDCPSLIGTSTDDDCWDYDRTKALNEASGVSYLRRYGCEWQFLEIDCA